MTIMINCNRESYRQALARVPTVAEGRILHQAAIDAGFNYMHDGRRIAPETWLMILRATMRGKRVLRFGLVEDQREFIMKLRDACPTFFEGMLVPADERDQEQPAA